MALDTGLLFCFLLWIFSPAAGKEFTITCLISEDCVLPCKFQSDGKGARIMWHKKKAVVSCTRYGNTDFIDGHNSQADEYKGRTGLYKDQVLKGNATLLLRNVTPHDEGNYVCITETRPRIQSSIISLIVKAPVQEVDVEFSGDSVTCRAEGIYPAPNLTWSTDPLCDARLLQEKTKSQKTRLGLYNIESSVMLTENTQTYICHVSSDTNKKTTFLKHEASIQASPGDDMMLLCSFPYSVLQSFKLTWRFGHSDPILSINVTDRKPQVTISNNWKLHVPNDLSASRSLNLRDLKSDHQGIFTCEVSTPEEKYITQTNITLTEECKENLYISASTGLTVSLSLLIGLPFVALVCYYYGKKIRKRPRVRRRREENAEGLNLPMNPLNR